MPGRMKIDFVDAMTVAVERAQHRRIGVGGKAEPNGIRLAQRLTERVEFVRGPTGVLAHKRGAKHTVGLQQVVGFERRRLVGDFIHRSVPSAEGSSY